MCLAQGPEEPARVAAQAQRAPVEMRRQEAQSEARPELRPPRHGASPERQEPTASKAWPVSPSARASTRTAAQPREGPPPEELRPRSAPEGRAALIRKSPA